MMHIKRLLPIAALAMTLLLGSCALALPARQPSQDDGQGTMTVDVMLQQPEGMTVTGQNPMPVSAGGDACFTVQLQEGYKIESVSEGAVYDRAAGTVTVSDVRFPTTIEVQTRLCRDYRFTLHNDPTQGTLTSNVNGTTVQEDATVTLRTEPIDGLVFLGYSENDSITHGGEVVCTARDYTFSMTEDVTLYTNYYNVGNGRLLIYDSNGGRESLQYAIFSDKNPFICPNAMALKGQITREGHVLYGYNTKPDGTGDYYGPGWSVIMPEDEDVPLTLYAQWLPVTEASAFTYTVKGGEATITRYEGDHETVVIPETLGGVPVVHIAADAFINGKFTTLYLSRNLLTIHDRAFNACRSLRTLYLCDTPHTMTDLAFANCPELQELFVLACLDPRYSTANGSLKQKYQRLITMDSPKIIFHGGSNVSYGIDTETVENMLGNTYHGVNFGCNQSTPAVFFAEVAAAHMGQGDLLVLCPEYYKYQYGYNEMNTTTWQIFEGAYNAYAEVDIRHFTHVFTSLAAYNANRYQSTVQTYEQYRRSGSAPAVTKLGDFNVNHNVQTVSLKKEIAEYQAAGGFGPQNIPLDLASSAYNQNMNRAIDLVVSRGGRVYISFAATMDVLLNRQSQKASHQQTFKQAVIQAFPRATVISDPATYILDHALFYNTGYHLTTQASVHRAELLARDILAQFAKET